MTDLDHDGHNATLLHGCTSESRTKIRVPSRADEAK